MKNVHQNYNEGPTPGRRAALRAPSTRQARSTPPQRVSTRHQSPYNARPARQNARSTALHCTTATTRQNRAKQSTQPVAHSPNSATNSDTSTVPRESSPRVKITQWWRRGKATDPSEHGHKCETALSGLSAHDITALRPADAHQQPPTTPCPPTRARSTPTHPPERAQAPRGRRQHPRRPDGPTRQLPFPGDTCHSRPIAICAPV